MIEFKGVAKQYLYGARVLGALDLKVADGEIIAVLGEEQSGKTTFLKVLAGVSECEGEVLIDGEKAHCKTDAVIMQFDDLALFKNRNFYNNLAFPLRLRKFSKDEIDKRVKYAAELLGITASLYTVARRATLADQKRMAAARLFLRDAKVLVLDDITRGLAREQADALWRDLAPLLLKKRREGAIVAFSSTDSREAASIADRIMVLHAGEIKQIGSVKEIYHKPQSVWAAEAIDGNYNREAALLTRERGETELVFDDGVRVGASALDGKFSEEYVGKRVLIGAHAEGFATQGRTERVKYSLRDMNGYILFTESGKKVRSQKLADEICTEYRLECVTLFDSSNENSIMK